MTPTLLYHHLGEGVTAFSTTRHGGVSTGTYASLNINAYCGDALEHINENRRLLCQTLHLSSPSQLIIPHQIHQTEICIIDEALLALPDADRQRCLEGIDAVMTNVEDVCIGVSTADCIPLLVYDAEHRCACAVHAGWRGTVARIAEKAVKTMTATYGSKPETMTAVIGPGISVDSFEVGQEVYDAFMQAAFPMERIAVKHAKWHIDLPLCNRLQLEGAGIPSESMVDTNICTFSSASDFFSARRLGINSGRIYTGIMIRK